jgi:fermentation-respiration switch protein FrsA (DUF1100 family)
MTAPGARLSTPLSGDRSRKRHNPFAAIMIGLFGTSIAIWFGLATIAAHGIAFPPSYSRPHSRDSQPTLADPRRALDADFENVTIVRGDGHKLAAWWVPGGKPAAIILMDGLLMHDATDGAAGDRQNMMRYLKFVHAAGYPAIALDEIDHGDSDDTGGGIGYGWRQRDDVIAAAAWIRARGIGKVGALGVSQGAAAALFAQAQSHPLGAIVSDSCYANLGNLLRRQPSIGRLNPAFAATILWESRFWIGAPPDEIVPAAAANQSSGPLMVIQGDADQLVPVADGQAIYAAARGDKEIWIVAGAAHAGAIGVAPDEYARRVIGFFDRHLLATR